MKRIHWKILMALGWVLNLAGWVFMIRSMFTSPVWISAVLFAASVLSFALGLLVLNKVRR